MSTQQPLGSMSVLHPNLDLGRPLQAVREAGAAFIPHALSEPLRQQLQREIQDGPFERLPDQIGPVRQEADLFVDLVSTRKFATVAGDLHLSRSIPLWDAVLA
jgi:hypothetical protein